jgi:hypothetical protein
VHQPNDILFHTLDRVSAEEVVDGVGHIVRIFNNVGAEGDADNDVVGDEPEGVVEADVIGVGGCDRVPVCAAAAEGDVLEGPVAELLQANVKLLSYTEG